MNPSVRSVRSVRSTGLAWMLAALALLQGCAMVARNEIATTGPGSEFVPGSVEAYRKAQDQVLSELIAATHPLPAAGAASAPASAPAAAASAALAALSSGQQPAGVDWDQVVNAGMDYADQRCEEYLHALFRLNRDRKTATAQIGLLGTATAGVQAALDTAARQVALAALAFGLASSTVDNLSSNLLFELDPSSVRSLVKTQQAAYRAEVGTGYRTRIGAVAAIRGYAVLCIPANIESEVNLAVKKTVPETKSAAPEKGQPPVVTNGQIVSKLLSFGGADTRTKAVLNAFVFGPDNKPIDANRRRLEAFILSRGLGQLSVVSFIEGEGFVADREAAVQTLKLK